VEIVLRIIGWLSIPLLIFSVWMMVRSLKKERTITIPSLVLQIAVSVVVLILYVVLLKVSPPTGWSWALIAVGLIIGFLQSRTTSLRVDRGKVLGKRSVWFLVVWAATFSITQLLALVGQGVAASYGLLTVYLATGLSVGANIGLMISRQRALVKARSEQIVCPNCNRNIPIGTRFCTYCGAQLATVPVEAEIAAAYCPGCGKANAANQRFCTDCGTSLID
jgi:hypothetical protein